MEYVDLHVHSNASDGTLPPAQVVELGAQISLAALALTDHDTVKGIPEALDAAENLRKQGKEIQVIPGVELSAAYKQSDIHILGLFIDHEHPPLIEALDSAVAERDSRNAKMILNLQNAGLDVSMDALTALAGESVVTRSHFAQYLVEQHYCKDRQDAFHKYLRADGPYYVGRKYMSPELAISLILDAGGIPILAHPLLYHLTERELKDLIEQLVSFGLEGLEAMHSSNVSNEEPFLISLARSLHLKISGGSDFHGSAKPDIKLGIGRGNLKVPSHILDDLMG